MLAGLSGARAESGVSVSAVSTFDADYLLVKDLAGARDTLQHAGFLF